MKISFKASGPDTIVHGLPPGGDCVEWNPDEGDAKVGDNQVHQQQVVIRLQLKHCLSFYACIYEVVFSSLSIIVYHFMPFTDFFPFGISSGPYMGLFLAFSETYKAGRRN